MDEEVAKQIHLDEMVAKRMAEEEALSEQQKKRKAQVQFEAQYYTEEDWDAIRAKLEAMQEVDQKMCWERFALRRLCQKEMVSYGESKKENFAEERAKAKRNKPMTQSQLRIYMSNLSKRQGIEKAFLIKELQRQIEQIWRRALDQTSKKQKIDDKDVPTIGEKVTEVKEEDPVKRIGKRKKQKARKGEIFFVKDASIVMLKMKLLDGTMDEVCYQLLKMIEKQAGIRK
ncbi:hypothetical protein Tco_0391172 [Tanacetum coccineum]